MKSVVRPPKKIGDFGRTPWTVVRGDDSVEHQSFSTRREARLFARIRNRCPDFKTAVREYAAS